MFTLYGNSINRAVACQFIKEAMSNEEIEYNALKLLEANPQLSQRQLSAELGRQSRQGALRLKVADSRWLGQVG